MRIDQWRIEGRSDGERGTWAEETMGDAQGEGKPSLGTRGLFAELVCRCSAKDRLVSSNGSSAPSCVFWQRMSRPVCKQPCLTTFESPTELHQGGRVLQ